jgi:hypothetical protein
MLRKEMQRIVNRVCCRASRQGYLLGQEVRDELAAAGLPGALWVDVVSLARDMLNNRDGCQCYPTVASSSGQEQDRQRQLQRAVRELIRDYRSCTDQERRRHKRLHGAIQPVQVETEDGRKSTLLSCDLSTHGIRLIGPKTLLGQKLRITLPTRAATEQRCFVVQIVWSKLVSDGLYENGGAFSDISEPPCSISTSDLAIPSHLRGMTC